VADAKTRVVTTAALAVALVCVLSGCAGSTTSKAAPDGDCGPVEQIAIQGGSHLIGEREPPVAYNSTPPTSGWHTSGSIEPTVATADDPLSEPEQVSVLEAGGAVVTYRGLASEDVDALEDAVAERFADRVAVTPYRKLGEGEVAFTAWGRLQRCRGLDLEALDAFVAAHAPSDLDAPAGH